MSRSNVSKLVLVTKKLERKKAKIERRIDNLKREYVDTLNALKRLDEEVLALLQPQIDEIQKELIQPVEEKQPINIPVVPEDAVLPQGE